MKNENSNTPVQEFNEVVNIILSHRSKASIAVNDETLLSAWHIGAYISHKLKSEEWGSQVVSKLSEYIRSQHPELRGYSRRNLYNMIMFYDEYSSTEFQAVLHTYISSESRLSKQIGVVTLSEQREKSDSTEIVQLPTAQFPPILSLTTLTNHIGILCQCSSFEERLFYILYAYKEHLGIKELQRCIENQTYATLLSGRKNMSKGLLETYPNAPIMLKDTLFVDFLGLPQKHSESRLKKGLIEHMKEFILELGKDFLFVDQEYTLNVGGSIFKVDLLFYHRGLQALVAVELKKTKFHPRDLGQLEFYLEALDRDVKRTNENPSIGILLCPEADHVVVEYAMNRSMSPTMVAEYKRMLIPQEKMQQLLKEFCQFLADNDVSLIEICT